MNHYFYKPGDKIESDVENFDFHRGEKYEIAKVWKYDGVLQLTVINKYGKEVPYNYGKWNYPSDALSKTMWLRQFRARLMFAYKTKSNILVHEPFTSNHWTYELSFGSHYIGRKSENNPIGHVEKYLREGDKNTRRDEFKPVYFANLEEYYKFFEDMYLETVKNQSYHSGPSYDFMIEGMRGGAQEECDFQFWLNIENFENAPPIEGTGYRDPHHRSDISSKEFIQYISELIFDTPMIYDMKQKQLVKDILTLFKELPGSHGSTSVAKVLLGKSKIKNSKADPFFGKYDTKFIKYIQMFELVSRIENYMWSSKIFLTKEEYGSGKEWRGTFEFVGSKQINMDNYNRLVDEIDYELDLAL
jgi:hypothetical protein